MSLTLKRPKEDGPEEKPVKAKPAKPARPAKAAKTKRARSFSPSKASVPTGPRALVVGGEPRVDLLPPEVRANRTAKRTRRRLGYALIGVIVVTIAAIGGATAISVNSQVQLGDAQLQTSSLLAQQQKYSSVLVAQNQVQLTQAAQQVGASTEIDWKAYLDKVQATLPANVTISTVTIDSSSPLALYAQSAAPLQGSRVATISFAAQSPTLPEVPAWLDALATLPAFADAVPGSVTLDAATNVYTANITMHVNSAAFDNRFAPKEK